MKYESHRDKTEKVKEPREKFSLADTLATRLGDQPIVLSEQKQESGQVQEVQKQQPKEKEYIAPKESKTAIVSFRYKGQHPDLSETVINKVLQQYLKKNRLVSYPRIFKHKCYLDFTEIPDLVLLKDKFQEYYPKMEVFSHFDLPNQKDLNTVYLGRLLGVNINLLKDASEELLDEQPVDIRIPMKNGKQCSYGYLEFTNRNAAKQAVLKFSGLSLGLTDGIRATLFVED